MKSLSLPNSKLNAWAVIFKIQWVVDIPKIHELNGLLASSIDKWLHFLQLTWKNQNGFSFIFQENCNCCLLKINKKIYMKMYLKMLSVKWQPFCLSLNVLTHWGWDKMAAIFQTTFWNAFSWMKIFDFWFVPQVPINNIPALAQIMAWRRPGADKPLSEPMMVILLTHICVTRPQWVNPYHARPGSFWAR